MDYTVSGRKLLFIEDDEKLKREMVEYFSPANAVFTASDVEDAVGILMRTGDVDAVVLDLILKSSMGIDLFKAFAALPPVIILSSLDGEENVMAGLTSGAADYVTKPCSMRLLETHIALRLLPKADAVASFGLFSVDANTRTVKYKNMPVVLTPSEFNILFFLVKHRGQYFTADEIYEKIWCAPSLHTTTIRAHLSSLRRKLKEALPDTDMIRTEFNKGYCFTGGGGY
jgi:two component transcriptional regulator, winged helix family